MKKEKLESAFPMMYDNPGCRGMSKRFYAACAAMQGILSSDILMNTAITLSKRLSCEKDYAICKMAYELADEMLKQEYKCTSSPTTEP